MKWTLAKAAAKLKRRARGRSDLPSIWAMTDDQRMADPVSQARSLPPGAAVIFRHYASGTRADQAVALRSWCRRRGLRLVVAVSWEIAARVDADGLHLPEMVRVLAPGARLWRRQKKRLLTMSAHNAAGVRWAEHLGADAVLVSPVFPTASHPERSGLGVLRLMRMIRRSHIAVIALGGITTQTVRRLDGSGVAGIAGISFVID